MKKTGWYSGDQKPVRVGLYEVKNRDDSRRVGYKWWDGKRWSLFRRNLQEAVAFNRKPSGFQESIWRGLTEKAK